MVRRTTQKERHSGNRVGNSKSKALRIQLNAAGDICGAGNDMTQTAWRSGPVFPD